MTNLTEFTARLLSRRGALLEPIGDGFEVVLPSDVATALKIAEHTTLSFGAPAEDGVVVTHTSDVFGAMGALLADRGAFGVVHLPAPAVSLDRLEQRLTEKVALTNAVFAVERRETRPASSLMVYARYTARSDQQQDGIVALTINEGNLAVRRVGVEDVDLLANAQEGPLGGPLDGVERQALDVVLRAAQKAQQALITLDLREFVQSLERRLNRDIHRVHEYYQSLIEEWSRRRAKKGEADQDGSAGKITAIETESNWKVQDLVAKYALRVQIDPIAFLRIEAPTPTFWLAIKRRKQTRSFPLTYDPLMKALDRLPCESCFYPQSPLSVCDHRLHLVC